MNSKGVLILSKRNSSIEICLYFRFYCCSCSDEIRVNLCVAPTYVLYVQSDAKAIEIPVD